MLSGPYGLSSGVPQPVLADHGTVSMWSVVSFWDQTSAELGSGTRRRLSERVMVSLEASSGAMGDEWPLENVWVRELLVPILVSFEVVSRVMEEESVDGKTADGAIGWES